MSAKETLQSIIEDFDLEKFETFFREKNNLLSFPNERLFLGDDNLTDGVKLAEGNLEDGNLIICVFKSLKELSERSSKKDQYALGKKVLKEHQTDSGIFIFYDNKGRFRFSLIYTNYSGTHRDFSTFKRFTYFVSKEQTNKTFLKQIGDGDLSTIANIKEAFSVDKVTKEFYTDIANWYFWAVRNTTFPPKAEEENGRNIVIIRLITRMIFIWFMKERGLISREFFNSESVSELINDLSNNESSYYKAILQNLFFATLNTKIEDRKFRFQLSNHGYNRDYMDHTVYRYEKYFKNKDKAFSLFKEIPFLNGGLFDCLDRRIRENGKNVEIRIDGFSDKEVGLSVPNFLFFASERVIDLNEEYGTKNKKYKVSGLLNILSSYNFTIDENVPIDQEVALDPELLGKVFENLLASYNPETATTARKATGSYYTPREIVDYMVLESLKNYFKAHLESIDSIDVKLENLFSIEETENPFNSVETEKIISLIDDLRIVDPAVGSGAFPMGILNKLVFVLSKLDPDNELWKKTQLDGVDKSITEPVLKNKIKEQVKKQFREKNFDYGRKLYLIQKCIYGVDVQQIAVEIAKLRFFISLLVDEKIDKDKYNQGIEPLPNLSFKIMQGDSLISEFMGIDLDKDAEQDNQELFEDEINKLIKDFRDKKNEFQNESDKAKKDSLMNDINSLIINIFKTKLRTERKGYSYKIKGIEENYSRLPDAKTRNELIEKENQALYTKEGFYLDSVEKQLKEFTEGQKKKSFFAWKLYFAEVFEEKGGFDIVIGNPPYIGEKNHKDMFEPVKKSELGRFYLGKMDYFYFFFHKALDIARENGIIAFITTNYYITATGARKLRQDFKKRAIIKHLINFNELKIFESALGQHNMITILKKGQNENEIAKTCITKRKGFIDAEIVKQILSGKDTETQYYEVRQKELYDGEENYIRITGVENSDVASDPIQKILDKVKLQSVPLGSICNVNQGIVTGADKVSQKHIEKYNINANVGDGIFVLSNEEVKKLNLTPDEKEILKPWFKNSDIFRWETLLSTTEKLIYADKRLRNLEGNKLKEHLQRFKKILDDSTVNSPYLHRPRDINFDSKKIVAPQRSPRNTFGYNEIRWYASADVYFITEKDKSISLKYVLALLNSKLYYVWLYYRGKRKGESLELYQKPLSEVPIKKILKSAQRPFIEVVDEILAAKKQNHQADISALEREIDNLVYKLYDLTPAEINIIENNIEKGGIKIIEVN